VNPLVRPAVHKPLLAIGPIAWIAILSALACGPEDVEPRAPEARPKQTVPAAAEPAPLRNVVLITLDTVRADALGSYGQILPSSPHLDRMAVEGVRFDQVVTSAPSTLPSHATLLTGKQPYAHGARSNAGYALAPGNVSLAEVLRDRGYRTGAEIAASVIARQTGLDQGFESYRDPFSQTVARLRIRIEGPEGERSIEVPQRRAPDITDGGIAFVREHHEEPFFLWLHYFDAHRGLFPPPLPFADQIPESRYHAEVLAIDDQIGRLREVLVDLDLRERTLVVVTSDHGEGLGEHGEISHAYYVYDTTMRVPLILWGPSSIGSGRVIEPLVRTVDVAPTILEWLALPPLEDVQGVSLLGLLDGRSSDLNLTGYGEALDFVAFGTSPLRFVREGRWKYIHKVGPELYDLERDPGEKDDMIERRGEVAAHLRARLEELIAAAPPKPRGAEIELDEETRSQLLALGYVDMPPPAVLEDERASLEPKGIDPRDATRDVTILSEAMGAKQAERWVLCVEKFGGLWEKYGHVFFGRHLADCQVEVGDFAAVAEVLDAVAGLAPAEPELLTRLADAQMRIGAGAAAERRLKEALAADRCTASARAVLAILAFSRGRYVEQIAILNEGAETCPENIDVLNNLAWALATLPDANLRDGPRAVRLALRAVELDRRPDAGHLDTLAVAYAEVGDFDRAVEVAGRAIAIERLRRPPVQLAVLRQHLARLEAREAVRDPE
jgi:arylsulfatase A-like enzyme